MSYEKSVVLDLEIGTGVEGFLVGHADGGFLGKVHFDQGHDEDDARDDHGEDRDQEDVVVGEVVLG